MIHPTSEISWRPVLYCTTCVSYSVTFAFRNGSKVHLQTSLAIMKVETMLIESVMLLPITYTVKCICDSIDTVFSLLLQYYIIMQSVGLSIMHSVGSSNAQLSMSLIVVQISRLELIIPE